MAQAYGTHEFGTSELEGLAKYLRQRAICVKKPRKRDELLGYAVVVESAADRIVALEHFKQTALRQEKLTA